jgi:hypothetical protein
MNEKKDRRNKIIVILFVLLSISICTNVYNGKRKPVEPSRTGEQLTGTIDEQGDYILVQRGTIEQLQSDLDTAIAAAESANRRADDAEREGRIAVELSRQSTEWANRIRATSGSLVENQRIINEYVRWSITNYSRP